MTTVDVATGSTEPINALALDSTGQPLTGLTDVRIKIRRLSDGWHYDWSDDTFKAPGTETQLLQVLGEISATYWPGQYMLTGGWDMSAIANPVADDVYHVTVEQASGDAANMPQVGEIKTGRWVDRIDTPVSDAATPAEVLTQAGQALVAYRLHQLVLTDPAGAPPADGTYVKQLLDNQVELLTGQYVIKQSYSYDPALDRLTGQVWVEKSGQVVPDPVSAQVAWHDADGTEMFVMADAAPDSQGVFKVTEDAPGLGHNRSYYAVASVELTGLGVITSAKGAFTLG